MMEVGVLMLIKPRKFPGNNHSKWRMKKSSPVLKVAVIHPDSRYVLDAVLWTDRCSLMRS